MAQKKQAASNRPRSRKLSLLLRTSELVLTAITCGLAFWLLLGGLAVPAGGETSAAHAAVFIVCAALIGVVGALCGLVALCSKNSRLKSMKSGLKGLGQFHYWPIYIGVLYLIIGAVAAWFAISQSRGESQCSANLSAFRGCGVLLAAICMNCSGLVATLVCAVTEVSRIRQWKSLIKQSQVADGVYLGAV